jgi:polyribonucleotide nucleotidyltransferase
MNRTSNFSGLVTDQHHQTKRSIKLKIPKDLTGVLTGYGNPIIKALEQETGAEIKISENDLSGFVRITAYEKGIREITVKIIDTISRVPKIGAVYTGTVTDILPTGALIEIMPGVTGLLPVFEICWNKITSPADVLYVGEKTQVKLTDMDLKEGKFRFSRKVLLPDINNVLVSD